MQSVLFEHHDGGAEAEEAQLRDLFVDLNLDLVLESMTVGRAEYGLERVFYAPLDEAAAVHYRHGVLRDLENADVLASVTRFARSMAELRTHLAQMEKLTCALQRQAWYLDAVDIYCNAIRTLAEELAAIDLSSRGFSALREYLDEYLGSQLVRSLTAQTQALKHALAEVRYRVRIRGTRVTVSRFEGDADYSAEVLETFDRFRRGAVKSYLATLTDFVEMNRVEERILECVAALHPDVFGALEDFCVQYPEYLDPTIQRFDREVQFYLGYLELIGPLRSAGLSFCYPEVSASSKEIYATETFDVALADMLVPKGGTVICNDFHLEGAERILVVTGPNNGGKTTFARNFGQLHYLASLGLPVPGRKARLFLPDRIFTHFERDEHIATLRGKLDDELVRVREMLEQATSNSIVVMNESFNSTTLSDALFVGTEVLRRIVELEPLGVYVTFVDELASLDKATVSMVSEVLPENPSERTYKLARKPADGLAHAWALAESHGLTYERLVERVRV